jgi:hypothetical protein
MCQSGSRARKAAQALLDRGGVRLVCLNGNVEDAERAGISIYKGTRKTISIERQVRICAGALIVLGTIMAPFASERFLIIPFFLGCGLVFGISICRCYGLVRHGDCSCQDAVE